MTALGVGLIGTGFMGKCHALAWNAVAPVFGDVARPRLAVLCDVESGLAARRVAEFGFARSTVDWRALIDDPAVDAVSITTPNEFHAEMAIHALSRGKHVWCEKPMAPRLSDAEAMAEAAARSGGVAILGYSYIVNPAIQFIAKEIAAGTIGAVQHVRIEMDEDFMADPQGAHHWKNLNASGYGVLDDFAVHTFSLLFVLLGRVERVFADMSRPYDWRPMPDGGRGPVENHDVATILLRLQGGIGGTIQVSRCAWGRKSRLVIQVFGSAGTIAFDQERMNEVQLYTTGGPRDAQGFRTILMAPQHPPFERFLPAPGHQLGFNDLKVIECRNFLGRIRGEKRLAIDFADGLSFERAVHAAAASFRDGRWRDVARRAADEVVG